MARATVAESSVRMLDRSRPFGTVHPPEGSLYYAQDGFYFDANGRHVPLAGDPQMPARPAAPAAAVAAAANEGNGGDAGGEEANGAVLVGDVNLTAWALGTQKYVFGKVMKAFRDRYSINIVNEIDGLTFLIDEGVVTAAQVAEARGRDWAERA
jgi:hypothetical protein